jgi:predicted small metal-binding protein
MQTSLGNNEGRYEMGKVLRCRDVGMDCDFVARADSEEELLKKAAEHAAKTHNMKEIPAEVLSKVRAAIRNE